MEPLVSLSDGLAASRNSDLGYYLEEARLAPAASSPLRGAQPVRHNLMHSDMVRQRAAQAAKEAEGAARPAPVVLDYVPSIRSQASRGSLLAQPSQKRLLCGGGGGISLMGDDDNGSAAAARRLEYVPKKSISCRSSHANQYSGSTLLGASSSSRPLSPTNSRPSASQPGHQISDCLPGSPRTAGADSGERCFHVTRAGTAIATASAAAAGGGSNSGSLLPSSASGGLPMGAARRRGAVERRDSSSCSQVHFGPTAVLQAPATPSLPAQRSTPSHEMSRRAQRGIVPVPALDTRPGAWTTTTTTSSPSSRLHMQLSGGDAAAAGRRAVLHEVLGSAAWTGAGTAPSSPLAAAALSASGIAGRGASCSGAVRIDGGEAATAAAGSYGPGSASRAAGRAARLLESLQRLNVTVPEVKLVQ
ncbi:hypothetical protein PLESTM_001180300 [Pleodorina starrii]|nr:hypothetical protein PLESTM_001180300 [Pleodorina starrii]